MCFPNFVDIFSMTQTVEWSISDILSMVIKKLGNSVEKVNQKNKSKKCCLGWRVASLNLLSNSLIALIFLQVGNAVTHFGSQCNILKSKDNLVTNMSLSSLTSWTDGGGRAIARPMKPLTADEDGFLFIFWGRSFPSSRTTCKKVNNLFCVLLIRP